MNKRHREGGKTGFDRIRWEGDFSQERMKQVVREDPNYREGSIAMNRNGSEEIIKGMRSTFDDEAVPQVPMARRFSDDGVPMWRPKEPEPDKAGLPKGWRDAKLPVWLSAVKQSLARASTFEELKAVEDQTEQLKIVAKFYFDNDIWRDATRLRNNARRAVGLLCAVYKNACRELKTPGRQKIGRGRPSHPKLPDEARSAGLTERVIRSAETIAKIAQPQFDAMNNADKPATIKQLEDAGKTKRTNGADTGAPIRKPAFSVREYDDANKLNALLKADRKAAKSINLDQAFKVMKPTERAKALGEIREAVAWWARALEKAEVTYGATRASHDAARGC